MIPLPGSMRVPSPERPEGATETGKAGRGAGEVAIGNGEKIGITWDLCGGFLVIRYGFYGDDIGTIRDFKGFMMIYDCFLGSHQVILGHCPYFASRVRTDT